MKGEKTTQEERKERDSHHGGNSSTSRPGVFPVTYGPGGGAIAHRYNVSLQSRLDPKLNLFFNPLLSKLDSFITRYQWLDGTNKIDSVPSSMARQRTPAQKKAADETLEIYQEIKNLLPQLRSDDTLRIEFLKNFYKEKEGTVKTWLNRVSSSEAVLITYEQKISWWGNKPYDAERQRIKNPLVKLLNLILKDQRYSPEKITAAVREYQAKSTKVKKGKEKTNQPEVQPEGAIKELKQQFEGLSKKFNGLDEQLKKEKEEKKKLEEQLEREAKEKQELGTKLEESTKRETLALGDVQKLKEQLAQAKAEREKVKAENRRLTRRLTLLQGDNRNSTQGEDGENNKLFASRVSSRPSVQSERSEASEKQKIREITSELCFKAICDIEHYINESGSSDESLLNFLAELLKNQKNNYTQTLVREFKNKLPSDQKLEKILSEISNSKISDMMPKLIYKKLSQRTLVIRQVANREFFLPKSLTKKLRPYQKEQEGLENQKEIGGPSNLK